MDPDGGVFCQRRAAEERFGCLAHALPNPQAALTAESGSAPACPRPVKSPDLTSSAFLVSGGWSGSFFRTGRESMV